MTDNQPIKIRPWSEIVLDNFFMSFHRSKTSAMRKCFLGLALRFVY